MGEGRWTLRGIPERVRETVRRICRGTGMSAGEVVTAAIEHFAKAHPEVFRACHADDDDGLRRLLQELQAKLEMQERLIEELVNGAGAILVDR